MLKHVPTDPGEVRPAAGEAEPDPAEQSRPRGRRRSRARPTSAPQTTAPRPPQPIRILTAVPLCDGHDSAISTVNAELVDAGVEVIYLGYHRSVRDIVRAAIQEDVRAVGISSYNGGHVEFFSRVVADLRARGAGHIGVFGGGGGTITPGDAALLARRGVDRIFFAGTPLDEMIQYVRDRYGARRPVSPASPRQRAGPRAADPDLRLAQALTACEEGRPPRSGTGVSPVKQRNHHPPPAPRVIGVTGPGGVGKTTLIDELVLRALQARPDARIAILSHDPSLVGNGALLGDRAAMIYSQDDRVFMRSVATRGQAGGVARTTADCLRALRSFDFGGARGFDLVIVETVGIGQEALPFPTGLVDRSVLVMSPEYGSRLQLQKIGMIDLADVIVINKSDYPGARTASSEIEQRLRLRRAAVPRPVIGTVAKRHRDLGVDELFRLIASAPD